MRRCGDAPVSHHRSELDARFLGAGQLAAVELHSRQSQWRGIMKNIVATAGLTVLAALGPCSPLLAQDASAPAPASPAATPPAAAPAAPAAAAAAATGGDIIVTAQRRSERLRDVPLSITALSGASLAKSGVTNASELGTVTPGLKWDVLGGYSEPAIRGVSTSLDQAGNETNVAIYVDGIYQPSSSGAGFELPDVNRIEVLKGPQGTLFGRNATGGAIQIVTLDPSSTWGGTATAQYENFNTKTFKGYLTGPITEGVSFGLAGNYSDSDGFDDDLLTGRHHVDGAHARLVRGKILIQPTSNLSILATGYYSKLTDRGSSAYIPLNGNTSAASTPGAIIPGPYQIAYNVDPQSSVESYGASVRTRLETQAGTVTSLTGWSRVLTDLAVDADWAFTPALESELVKTVPEREQALTEELNFVSKKYGPVSFVSGFFYYDGYGAYDPLEVEVPGANVFIYSKQKVRSYAGYGEVYLDLTDRLRIIGGLRYTSETRSLAGAQALELGNDSLAPGKPAFADLGRRTDTKLTPRASIRYALSPSTNVYFTYSQGFKSGAFNSSNISPQTGIKPEDLTAYEVGIKSRLGPLDFSASGFYYDYSNIQVAARTVANGVEISVIQNAAAAHIYGADIDATLNISHDFSVRAAAAYLHATFTSFPDAEVNAPIPGGGNATISEDVTGNTLIRSPKFTLTLIPSYSTQAFGGKLDLSSTLFYTSKFYEDNADRLTQRAYAQLAANVAWTPENSHFTFRVFGKNLTNKTVIAGSLLTSGGDGVLFAPPRTYGGSITYKF
jgi:iron complex outermembrane receptor protein